MMLGISIAEAAAAASAHRPRPETHRERAKRFYTSQAWRRLRFQALAANAARHADGAPHCELCGRSRRDGIVLDVDHIIPMSKDWSKRLDPGNVQIFCHDDNAGKLNRSTVDFRPPEAQEEITA